jgi:exodeoxyribonuclease V beta subunit
VSTTPGTFDICGPLPSGTTVLEASAGTGKTFTIAALAARYVAEGIARLDQLMLVTFGRNATQELRERVRQRLVSAQRGLADPAYARTGDDDLLRLLADVPDVEVALRRKRLTTALANFDAATIATTHGFCLQMLTGLGVAGDFEPGATFVESVDDIVQEVVADLYLRKWGRPDSPAPLVPYKEALETVRKAVRDPHAELEPSGADPDSTAGQRRGLAAAARTEVDVRKRRRRVRDYDDLLTRLRDALVDSESGPAAQERVRSRYKVVLVDEFQDTDPVQWDILRLAFHRHTTLILIGDPKQAVYAFRGGDVVTYLAAAGQATSSSTLGRNWRSDKPLLEALAALFGEAALGDPGIVVRPVESAHPAPRLSGAPEPALRLRVATREQFGVIPVDLPRVDPARELVARDLARDVVRLLGSGMTVATSGEPRPVEPGDVAVLVRRNEDALLVHDELSAVGVPAVLTGLTNVFATSMAQEWLVLLQALEQPNRRRVRTAALGCFVGWDAQRLADAGDGALDELGPLLQGWAGVLSQRGIPALLEVATEKADLFKRLLSRPTGERQLTDLRQLAQLLHAAATVEQLGPVALVEWLQRRIADARADPTEERSRRLDSDARAVQVITVHRSKGLEFPIVYVPYGWDRNVSASTYPLFHTPDGVRSLDVGGRTGPDFATHCALNAVEEAGESLRLFYVAVTRAQCQVVTWWVPTRNTEASPAHRLLFGRFAPGEEPPATQDVPSDAEAWWHLGQRERDSAGRIALERIGPLGSVAWQPARDARPALGAAQFTRRLDASWRRTSYTALTSAAHDPERAVVGVSSEPEERGLDDEGDQPATSPGDAMPAVGVAADDQAMLAVLSPMRELPSGTGFGIAVHSILEAVDASAPDLAAELVDRSHAVLDRRFGTALDADSLGAALLPAMETPLGPLAGGARLRDVMPPDRLAELSFELPLAGGDSPAATSATLAAFAGVLRRHLRPDDPFAAYPDVLSGRDFRSERLRGYLVGSLDAVLRLPGEDTDGRFVVVDYKTNWLGAPSSYDGPLTAWHYRPEALEEAMLAAHYPLQLLLYLVALHRFLRWRQPGYDPDLHLAGGLYLFLRGMSGAATPQVNGAPCGVFGWRPPKGLVPELSSLLAGGGDA